jgi:Uma2 family endonuclease
MTTTILSPVSLTEYLNTTYKPDMDFIEGVLVERHVGTQRHGLLQSIVVMMFARYLNSHAIKVFTETRLRVRETRHRIPDIMILETPYIKVQVVVDAPAIVIEIKSPDDSFDDILQRCFDYADLSTPNIIIMDLDNRRTWIFRDGSLLLLSGDSVELTLPKQQAKLVFPFGQMFIDLDAD